jgi:hypothetical protein
MTIRIVRVGERLMVEIPEKLAKREALAAGQAVEWVTNGVSSISLVKKTVSDGLLEVESRIAKNTAKEEHLLSTRSRAELGDLDAQKFLGMVSEDKAEAAKWLRLAAEQGDRYSMWHLGYMLINGDRVEKNTADGYFWLLLSASTYSLKSTKQERAGMNEECRKLQKIAEGLTEEERKRIEEHCRDWLEVHKLTECFKPKL